MGNVFIDDTILSDIAEAIRSKTGKTDLLLPSEMPAEIESITTGSSSDSSGSDSGSSGSGGSSGDSSGSGSSGDSSGGSSGGSSSGSTGELLIPEGFTINFYDTENELVESHSAKFGFLIEAPISYSVDSWQNSEGVIYSFPLTVTESMGAVATDLFAHKTERCEDILYKHFGMSKTVYPFLLVYVLDINNSFTYYVAFSSVQPGIGENAVNVNSAYIGSWHVGTYEEFDICVATRRVTQLISSTNFTNISISADSLVIYGNFEDELLDGRLDETPYTETTE